MQSINSGKFDSKIIFSWESEYSNFERDFFFSAGLTDMMRLFFSQCDLRKVKLLIIFSYIVIFAVFTGVNVTRLSLSES